MHLKILCLYYDLMNTYGDNGNLLSLKYRCQNRGIEVQTINYTINSPLELLEQADLLLMGGAEDRQQQIVAKDFTTEKEKILKQKISAQVPGLFICGAYQFLGKYYQINHQKLPGLNISDHYTLTLAKEPRLIGEIVTKVSHQQLLEHPQFQNKENQFLIGFENHGGRTYLTNQKQALATTIKGQGNNQSDLTEGVVINNLVGTYLHGPVLPRNPALADYLIEKALKIKYNQAVRLTAINDHLERENRRWLLNKLNVKNEKN